ncbi:hypothetical protein CVT25_012835 [Psilocybe cyanescens]|uniref:Protein kinase domain-containing protein n=1 Tax=Psilocybe cyanescens TaxID=93625 RepID=A0A409VR46_PSICY|nr:hypothetical protein CVT25_012835 [Psilocybe cyanescens]
MPASYSYIHIGILTATTLACLLSLPSSPLKKKRVPQRNKLPSNLDAWRWTQDDEEYNTVWDELRPLLEQHGFRLWRRAFGHQAQDDGHCPCDNFLFLTPDKTRNLSIVRWRNFLRFNGLSHAARNVHARRDVVLRVVTAGGEGQNHLRIIRRLSSPPDVLMSNNHILPIIYDMTFQDISILAFPKLIFNVQEAMDTDIANTVEDVLYMIVQAFEGVGYLHRNLIGHRDLFLNNFMVGWMPMSLSGRSLTRPRVYIIDFETAVDFSDDCVESERLCSEHPFGNDFDLEDYGRQLAPELSGDIQPYCPFKLDLWQLGSDLRDNFQTGVLELDQLWSSLALPVPENRMTAGDVLAFLDEYLRKTPSYELDRPITSVVQ